MRNTAAKQSNTVYETYRTAVYHTALAFVKDPALAEDVLQDVFLAYYRELQNGDVRHVRAWLLTATRNRCCNLLRDSRKEWLTDEVKVEAQDDPTDAVEDTDVVTRALKVLTEAEKLVFSLHYLDGYTYKEIATGLDIPIGTVQTRCHTARKKLRRTVRNIETGRGRSNEFS